MKVQSSARRRALLDIYQAHHMGRYGALSLKQLEREWKETGLRRSDLDAALKSGMQQQLLLPKRTHDGMFYELTYLGECAMQLVTAGGVLATVRDWFTLQRAKLRPRRAAANDTSARNRRVEDHAGIEIPRSRTQK